MKKTQRSIKKLKTLGIYGYVLKEFALIEIENCIEAVLNGKSYFSPEFLEFLEIVEPPQEWELLTPSEKEILKLIVKNNTGVEIGEIHSVSTRKVEKQKSNIIKKLELSHKQNSLLIWVKENQDYFL